MNRPLSTRHQKDYNIMKQNQLNILSKCSGNPSKLLQFFKKEPTQNQNVKNEKEISLKEHLNLLKQKRNENKTKKLITKNTDNKYLSKDNNVIENNNLNNNNNPITLISKKYEEQLNEKDKDILIKKLKSQINDLKTLIVKLNNALDKSNVIIPCMVEENKNTQNEKKLLINEFDEEYNKKNAELNNYILKENSLKEKVSNLEKEKDNYISINSSLTKKIMELKSQNNESNKNYIGKIEELINEKQNLENKNDELNKLIKKKNLKNKK